MKYSHCLESGYQQYMAPNGYKIVILFEGEPGGGKTNCAMDLAKRIQEAKKIPQERIVVFNASLREPCDIMGVPFKSANGQFAQWCPPEEFYNIRKGVGPSILILEELTDAPMSMQNPLCRIVLDRVAGSLELSEELYIIATGNRVEDRSGANRMSTKLGNRLRCITFEASIDDWVEWAYSKNLDDVLIKFLSFKPALLSDFDPKRKTNPTPRAWEKVAYTPQFTCKDADYIYMQHIAGDVGEGAAAEYVAFRKLYHSLPDFTQLLKDPEKYEVPSKLDVLYATCMKLASLGENMDKAEFTNMLKYILRVPMEMQATTCRELLRNPKTASKFRTSPMLTKLASAISMGY